MMMRKSLPQACALVNSINGLVFLRIAECFQNSLIAGSRKQSLAQMFVPALGGGVRKTYALHSADRVPIHCPKPLLLFIHRIQNRRSMSGLVAAPRFVNQRIRLEADLPLHKADSSHCDQHDDRWR